jgi:hypothetical protein
MRRITGATSEERAKVMSHTPHGLHEEFPELGPKIGELKSEDPHFAQLAERYDALNHAVERMEDGLEPVADEVLEDTKKERLALKDQIYAVLTQA